MYLNLQLWAGFTGPALPPSFPDDATPSTTLIYAPGTNSVDELHKKDLVGDTLLPGTDWVKSRAWNFNGVDETITTASDHGAIVSYSGTATLSYDGTTVTATAGTAWNILFTDGTYYRGVEGSGTLALDSSGNENHGTISTSNSLLFHGEYSDGITGVDLGTLGFSDGVLGSEQNPNVIFDTDTAGYIGNNAGATLAWQPDQTALFENTADWSYVRINPVLNLPAGTYLTTFDILEHNWVGNIHIGFGTSGNLISSTGTFEQEIAHTGGNLEWQLRPAQAGAGTIKIDNISIKQIITTPIPARYDGAGINSTTYDALNQTLQYKPNAQLPLTLCEAPCLTLTTSDTLVFTESVTIADYEGTATISTSGTTITCSVGGTLYKITLDDGRVLPCSEGSLSTHIFDSTDGTISAEINTSNLPLVWGTTQDEYFYSSNNTFWTKSGEAINYPYAVSGYETEHEAGKFDEARLVSYKMLENARLINADKLQDLAGTGPYMFTVDGAPIPKSWAELVSDGVMNYNKQLYGSLCKGIGFYNIQQTDAQDAETTPWFFCDDYVGCDSKLTIGTLSGVLKPSFFDSGVIDAFTWETTGDTITIEMETGYTPTDPYMGLTIAGLATTLAWDAGSESFIANGSHTAEDAAIVAYLEANPGGVACVRLAGKPEQVYTMTFDDDEMTYDGETMTYSGIPNL